ncbi:MAG: exo-alpha-sialidase [bacterium]|nr:exo-alpha-sialidase [bacterium]
MQWSYPQVLNSNGAADGSRSDYYPRLATDGSGVWLTVWASRDLAGGAYGDDMDIFFARSVDDGATWSSPAIVDPAATADDLHDSNPEVYTDGTNHWMVVWGSWDTGATSDIDLWYVVSTNGIDFSAPAHLNDDWATDPERDHDGTPHVAANPNGTWVAVWMKGKDYGDEHDIYTSRSTDHGRTWTSPVYLHASMTTDPGDDIVPRIASDGTGNMVVTWKSDNLIGSNGTADGDIHYSRSGDSGASWTAPAALNTDAGTDGVYDIEGTIATDGAGQWIAAWYREISGGLDRDIMFARSTDNGASWSSPAPLNTNWATDTGDDSRPRLVTNALGDWLVVWLSKDNLGIPMLGTDRDVFYAKSCDDGASWTPPAVLNGNAYTDFSKHDWSHDVALGLDGRVLVAWYTDDSLGGTIGSDRDLLFSTSVLERDGDRDLDGDVDLHDFAWFQACFTTTGPIESGCCLFDFDGDDDVDIDDYADFGAVLGDPVSGS